MRGGAVGLLILVILGLLGAGGSQPALAAGCPNEAIRSEQGVTALGLPGCRAYELVSPESVPTLGVAGQLPRGVRAATDGEAIAYGSPYPYPGSPSSSVFYRAKRNEGPWTVEAMDPQMLPSGSVKVYCESSKLYYSSDLRRSVLGIGFEVQSVFPGEGTCGVTQQELVPGEPRGFSNLFAETSDGSGYELVDRPPPGATPANAQFQDGSRDLTHVVFGEDAQLTPEAPAGYDLYERHEGDLYLVTFLPDGEPVRGDLAGAAQHVISQGVYEGGTYTGTARFTNAVSSDGERVFFYVDGNLYLRENAAQPPTAGGECSDFDPDRACTVEVDVSRGLGQSGGGVFQYASADGNRVFFTDERQLTFPTSAEAGKPDLYEYDVAEGELRDLTVGVGEAANVRGFSGASEDGSRLYFVALGALTGSEANAAGAVSQPRKPNLYLIEEGALTFIATLEAPKAGVAEDRSAWGYELASKEGKVPEVPVGEEGQVDPIRARASQDGRYLAFSSVRGLTGGPSGTRQIFLFDAATDGLSCASCLQSGPPAGPSELEQPVLEGEAEGPGYLNRAVTDSGQLFFSTEQALLPSDTDGTFDVYEYREGDLHLLSDGAGSGPSVFFDASEGGADVFFATSDRLVQADRDNAVNLYDTRVDGGFAEPPAETTPCSSGEACHPGSGSVGPGPSVSTAAVGGEGNVPKPKACAKGKVRHHGKCVKKTKKKHHAEKAGRKIKKNGRKSRAGHKKAAGSKKGDR
jgi:hypothetical protein